MLLKADFYSNSCTTCKNQRSETKPWFAMHWYPGPFLIFLLMRASMHLIQTVACFPA